jgi:hypothetical protein
MCPEKSVDAEGLESGTENAEQLKIVGLMLKHPPFRSLPAPAFDHRPGVPTAARAWVAARRGAAPDAVPVGFGANSPYYWLS